MTIRCHENTYTAGRMQRIVALVKAGTHKLEAWGNSREGFTLYLVPCDGITIGACAVSDWARRLSDLRNAARDQYGPVSVPIGRNW